MTRRSKLLRTAAAALIAILLIAGLTTIWVVQSDWFRSYVKEKIVTATDDAIGGKAELGSFAFDWRHLEANVENFVIHGTEPAGSAPLLRASEVRVRLRLFTSLKRIVSVSSLNVERPELNVIVDKDGNTNVPTPKTKASSGTPIETVVNLAIGHFELNRGVIRYSSSVQPLDLRGNDLRIELAYSLLKQAYEGELSLQPLYVVSGRNTPIVFSLNIPLTLERDRVSIHDATVSTERSALKIDGSIDNLRQPVASAHVLGQLSLVDLNNLSNLGLAVDPKSVESNITLDAEGVISQDSIQISNLHLALGNSTVSAKGTLQDPRSQGRVDFSANLDLAQIARLAKLSQRPTGVIALDGKAGFRGQRIDIDAFRLRAFGGEIYGSASLEQFARYQISAHVTTFDLQATEQRLGWKPLPYSGNLSGTIDARGDLSSGRSDNLVAATVLNISPGRVGIPVSGRVNVNYNAATGIFSAANSALRLPNTSLTFNGSLRGGVRFTITSRDLHDLLAAVPGAESNPLKLNGGQLGVQAVVSGSIQKPSVSGQLTATRLGIEGRQFDALAADFNATASRVSVANGSISRGTMRTQFAGSAGLAGWSPQPTSPLAVSATVMNGDVADLLALAGQSSSGYSGAVNAAVNINGTIANPTGSATVDASNGTVGGQPFDQAQVHVALGDRRVSLPDAFLIRKASRLNLAAEYTHTADSFTSGHLTVHVTSNGLDLSQIRTLVDQQPDTSGTLQLDATVSGNASSVADQDQFAITSIDGNLTARQTHFGGEDYGDLIATASTSRNAVTYNLTSSFAGSQIRANGQTQLVRDYPTSLDANLSNLMVERVLKLAKRTDIPAKGILSGTLHVAGTMKDPHGNADLNLANAVLYDEPLDRVHARLEYLPESLSLDQLEISDGPSRLNLSARFDHPPADLERGHLQFNLSSGTLDLARIRSLQQQRPGLAGSVQISGAGKVEIRPKPVANGPDDLANRIVLQDLNAHVGATGLTAQGKNLGNLTLAATTAAGRVNFILESNLARASIHGSGTAVLGGNYPVTADVSFSDLTWTNLQPLIAGGEAPAFEAASSGRITLSGPAGNLDQLNGSVRLTSLQIRPLKIQAAGSQSVSLQNQGDIAVRIDKGSMRIESARLTGPDTDINASGTASMSDGRLDLRLDAKANLALLKSLNPDVYCSGNVVAAITVQGTTRDPRANGRLELHSASITSADFPTGLQNANGLIVFNGNSGTIQSLTGESGGGKVSLTGFVTKENELRFALRVNATAVRVRVQQDVSVVTTASLNLSGTTQKSHLAGTATIDRLTYRPQADIGSILTRAGPPVQSPSEASPVLANMSLDVVVRTSSATEVQTELADNLDVIADLRIRGTAAQPGVIGSVQLNRGQLVFFGSSYKISSGTISFYNPTRIEPILQLSLATQAKGVAVTLSVTGPIDDMKLSYTSDPPLQFEEIVALLAAGSTPTSDPTLLANQPSQPSQSFQERGESALLGRALADPLSNRLQRVFGVSQLKIDPSFTSGSQLPQARVTLQQQIAPNLVFTYVTALDNSNTQVIRIEWSMTSRWSAAANRDENGLVSINLQYKMEFH